MHYFVKLFGISSFLLFGVIEKFVVVFLSYASNKLLSKKSESLNMTITGDDAVSLVSVIITSVLVTKFAEWVWENYYPFTSNDLSLKVIAFFTYIFVLWFAAWGTLIIVHLFNSMLNQRR